MRTGAGDDGAADYYDVLGVPDTASPEEILRAYRRLAREHHPDHNPGGGSNRFRQISDAYDVIGDAERRRRYDSERRGQPVRGVRIPVNRRAAAASAGERAGPATARAGSPGARRPSAGPASTGRDRPVIRLSFRDAVLGATAAVDVSEDRPCSGCGGSGRDPLDTGCPVCGGTGSVIRRSGQIPVRHVCSACGGRGRPAPSPCSACGGAGQVPGTRAVMIRIPAGVTDGATVRARRKAPHGPVEAVVRVQPDPRFGREGDDVTVRVAVTPAEATLGAEVAVPTVDGAPVTVRIPPGTQPGRRLRLAGRGIRRPDRPGDELVIVDVVVPTSLSDAERSAWEAVAAVSPSPRPPLTGS